MVKQGRVSGVLYWHASLKRDAKKQPPCPLRLPQPLHPCLPLRHRQLIQRKRSLLLNQRRQLRRVAGEPDLRVAAGLGD